MAAAAESCSPAQATQHSSQAAGGTALWVPGQLDSRSAADGLSVPSASHHLQGRSSKGRGFPPSRYASCTSNGLGAFCLGLRWLSCGRATCCAPAAASEGRPMLPAPPVEGALLPPSLCAVCSLRTLPSAVPAAAPAVKPQSHSRALSPPARMPPPEPLLPASAPAQAALRAANDRGVLLLLTDGEPSPQLWASSLAPSRRCTLACNASSGSWSSETSWAKGQAGSQRPVSCGELQHPALADSGCTGRNSV